VLFPLTFKEGANSGGPPDLRGRRQNPRPKRARMKSRVNSSARPPSQKENPPAQAAVCPQAIRDKANLKARETAQTWKAELFARIAFPKRLSSRNDKSEVPRLPRPRLGL
jgi:hypothetical protein